MLKISNTKTDTILTITQIFVPKFKTNKCRFAVGSLKTALEKPGILP